MTHAACPRVCSADLGAVRAALHEELTPLLVRRMRAGIWLLVAALLLFGVEVVAIYRGDARRSSRSRSSSCSHWCGRYWALSRRPRAWQRSIGIGTRRAHRSVRDHGLSSIITDDPVSALLLFIVLTMGTAMLLPWGVWPQVATVSVAAVMVAVNMIWVPAPQGGLESAAVATVLAFLTSVYASYALDRSRLARALGGGRRARQRRLARRGDRGRARLHHHHRSRRARSWSSIRPRSAPSVTGVPTCWAVRWPDRSFRRRCATRIGAASNAIAPTGVGSMLGRRIDTTAHALRTVSKFPIELAITRVPQPGPPVFIGYVRDLTALAQEARTAGALVRVGTRDDVAARHRPHPRAPVRAQHRGAGLRLQRLVRLAAARADVYVWTAGYGRAPEAARPSAASARISRAAIAPAAGAPAARRAGAGAAHGRRRGKRRRCCTPA